MPLIEFIELGADVHQIDRIEHYLKHIILNQERIMASIDDVLADEANEATALGQIANATQVLLANDASLKQQLADALAGVTLPPDVQTKIDAAVAASNGNVAAANQILANLAPPPPTSGSGQPAAA
jgi:hypothetical protein